MRKAFSFIIPCIIICAIFFFDSGCANIIPPTGGPRDSLPPVLINASPADSTTNFKGNRIVLTFDEYIKLDDPTKNVILTPTMETTPQPLEKRKLLPSVFAIRCLQTQRSRSILEMRSWILMKEIFHATSLTFSLLAHTWIRLNCAAK